MNPSCTYSFLDFFAGGGLVREGLGPTWIPLLSNDIDPAKCAAYRENFGNDNLIEDDINALSADVLPWVRTDLMWGSFPCQDLSLAGERRGLTASRSGNFFGFWHHVETLITRGIAPKIIAIENVTGLTSSRGGRDLAVILDMLAGRDYAVTTHIIDAKCFVPQSRPRLFILAMAKDVDIAPIASTVPTTAPPHIKKHTRQKWFSLAAQPPKTYRKKLADIIDWQAPLWHSPDQTRALIAMMSDSHLERIEALRRSGAKRCGAAFRRTRKADGRSIQRVEIRFDGLAGCLRTPAGGSSRQLIFAIEDGIVRSRLISSREAARLMGLPETFKLPAKETAALQLCGDGVCVPVVRWLAATALEPALNPQRKAAAA